VAKEASPSLAEVNDAEVGGEVRAATAETLEKPKRLLGAF
jgi:hypothetical protein